ncbi:PREDICTED: mRNA-decapping enzyme 1A-like, partial [Fulmarus glacialis]|uniref:mRNA-decapping enzyme 1A-like n=1 Tax=Fulmarus glacialis TaxID=30455 RepID=UPI00051C9C83
ALIQEDCDLRNVSIRHCIKTQFLLDRQFYHKTVKMEICGTSHCHMQHWSRTQLSVVAGHVVKVALKTEEKTDIEGTLFVYKRSASPYHGFTIVNRLNMHNLVEPVNKDLEFQLHEPFLLYRNASLSIYSIWFYDKNDCHRIAKLMAKVVEQEAQRSQQVSQDRKSPCRTNGCNENRPIDILEMLSKAKDEYER